MRFEEKPRPNPLLDFANSIKEAFSNVGTEGLKATEESLVGATQEGEVLGNVLPIKRNVRTGEKSFSFPRILDFIGDFNPMMRSVDVVDPLLKTGQVQRQTDIPAAVMRSAVARVDEEPPKVLYFDGEKEVQKLIEEFFPEDPLEQVPFRVDDDISNAPVVVEDDTYKSGMTREEIQKLAAMAPTDPSKIMNPERLQKAKELGFDTSKVWYRYDRQLDWDPNQAGGVQEGKRNATKVGSGFHLGTPLAAMERKGLGGTQAGEGFGQYLVRMNNPLRLSDDGVQSYQNALFEMADKYDDKFYELAEDLEKNYRDEWYNIFTESPRNMPQSIDPVDLVDLVTIVADSLDMPAQQFFEDSLWEVLGIDGFIYKNAVEDVGSDSIVLFYPSQLKSISAKFETINDDVRSIAVPPGQVTGPENEPQQDKSFDRLYLEGKAT